MQCDEFVHSESGTSQDVALRRAMTRKPRGECRQTHFRTFFTSFEVTAASVGETARAGRSRWQIENGMFNCLTRHGNHFERSFGHGWAGSECPN